MSSTKRPGWDRYFMDIAQVAAKRSNCSRRQVAAVLVRDKRIISTGYNGTPRGVRNCSDGGCPRCSSNANLRKFPCPQVVRMR
jgi:dCMP deaminase